jgi:hypothetical protein
MAFGLQVINELSQPAQQGTVLKSEQASADRPISNRHAFAVTLNARTPV